jgi:hypothetical protein
LERGSIVRSLVAEQGTELVEDWFVRDQKIPVVVTDLVAEVAEKRSIGLLLAVRRRSRSASSASFSASVMMPLSCPVITG